MKRRKKTNTKIYHTVPRGYKLVDCCRSAHQARSFQRSYPKDINAIIIKTGPSRGKKRDIFPYHIASNW